MTGLQLRRLQVGFNGRLELEKTLMITIRILLATAVAVALGWLVWTGLDAVLGHALIPELLALAVALGVALAVYGRLVLLMQVPEADQVRRLIAGRLARS